jgi:hypothetical protein
MTAAAFKRSIRDLQVWCSSCMVAFAGSDPIGVLIGAKRPSTTLVLRIAVHPDHRRQGHGGHLLSSLASKLAILGPPRIVAEVPETLVPACGLFGAAGYVQEALLTDYVLPCEEHDGQAGASMSKDSDGAFVIPVTVDDLAANGLLADAHSPSSWERSIDTLTARKAEIAGVAAASDERIEAYVLYVIGGPGADIDSPSPGTGERVRGSAELVSLRSFVDDGGTRLRQLLAHVRAGSPRTFRFAKVHPAELSKPSLEMLGFRPAGGHVLYAATARAA